MNVCPMVILYRICSARVQFPAKKEVLLSVNFSLAISQKRECPVVLHQLPIDLDNLATSAGIAYLRPFEGTRMHEQRLAHKSQPCSTLFFRIN
jgi:hypothetical protein